MGITHFLAGSRAVGVGVARAHVRCRGPRAGPIAGGAAVRGAGGPIVRVKTDT